jgi:hypothetical protein
LVSRAENKVLKLLKGLVTFAPGLILFIHHLQKRYLWCFKYSMNSTVRKAIFINHLVFSIGWLGAVLAFLVLAVFGFNSSSEFTVRSSYVSMELITLYAIVPASVLALATGVFQAVITSWGLFKHYWIFIKLLITAVATGLLLVHLQPIHMLASAAEDGMIAVEELRNLQLQLIFDAVAASGLLIATTIISVYKPWGKINFKFSFKMKKTKNFYLTAAMVLAIIAVIIAHLFGITPQH